SKFKHQQLRVEDESCDPTLRVQGPRALKRKSRIAKSGLKTPVYGGTPLSMVFDAKLSKTQFGDGEHVVPTYSPWSPEPPGLSAIKSSFPKSGWARSIFRLEARSNPV